VSEEPVPPQTPKPKRRFLPCGALGCTALLLLMICLLLPLLGKKYAIAHSATCKSDLRILGLACQN
jgi:hypothetical protein